MKDLEYIQNKINNLSDTEKTVFELLKEIQILRLLNTTYIISLLFFNIFALYKFNNSRIFFISSIIIILLALFGFTFFNWLYFGKTAQRIYRDK